MSKVTIQIDTKEKNIDVTVDGKSVGAVEAVHAFREINNKGDVDFFHMNITKVEEEGDLRKVTSLMAALSEAGKAAVRSGEASKSEFADFVAVEGKSGVQQDIETFLGQK